jgi:hypothetical protein
MQARKVSGYKGPHTSRAIITKIEQESKESGKQLSFYYIDRVITAFFSGAGFPYYLKRNLNIKIKGLGRFVIRHNFINMLEWHKVMKRDAKYRRFLRTKKAFEERNQKLVSVGMRPWTFFQFCSINKTPEFRLYNVNKTTINNINGKH